MLLATMHRPQMHDDLSKGGRRSRLSGSLPALLLTAARGLVPALTLSLALSLALSLGLAMSLGLGLLLTLPAHAQGGEGDAAGSTEATTTGPADDGRDTASLVRRLDTVSSRLTEVREYLRRPAPDLAGITVALPDRTQEARNVLGAAEEMSAFAPEAQAAIEKIRTLDRIFSRWRERLQQEVAVLDPWREQLRTEAAWFQGVATGADAGDEDLPEALRQRLSAVEGDIEATLTPLRRRLDVVVAADVRVGELQAALQEFSVQLAAAREARAQEPLALTAPPLWKLPDTLRPARELVAINFTTLAAGITDYVNARPGECLAFAVIFLLLLVAVYRLRRSLLNLSDGKDPRAADQLLIRYPVAVTLLVWTLVGPFLLLPEMPAGLELLRGLLDTILLWRLLPALVPPGQIRALTLLLLLSAAFILQLALLGDPWFGRFINLVVGVVAIPLVVRLARAAGEGNGPANAQAVGQGNGQNTGHNTDQNAGQSNSERPLVRRVVRILARLAPWVLAVGLVAEVAGARVLGQQAIGGTVFASLILCSVLAADSILRCMLEAFVGGPGARWSRAIRTWPDAVLGKGTLVVRLLLAVQVLILLPAILPVLQPLWKTVGGWLGAPLSLGSVELSVGGVLWFILGIVLAVAVARFVRFVLDEDLLPRLPIPMGSASAASRLVYYALVAGGVVFALAASGLELTKLTIVISALSVGIGFGLQNVVNNFVSGLVIAFERPFREGDQIALGSGGGNTTGRVQEIGLRATRIRTFDGAEVIVPNGNLISGEVVNWTLSDRARRVEINVGVAYGSDARRVETVLQEAIRELPGVAEQPEPRVVFKGFGASSLDFGVFFWTPDADSRVEVESEARFRILAALDQAGIGIPFPQMDVHLDPPPAP